MSLHNESTFLIDGGPITYQPTSEGMGCELFRCLEEHSKKTAVYSSITNSSLLYKDIKIRSVRMAMRFLQKGYTKDDIVCSCGPNDKNSCIPFVASFLTGCIFTAFELNQPPDATKYILNYLKPRTLFISSTNISATEELLKDVSFLCEIVVWEKNHKYLSLQDLIQPIVGEETFRPKEVDDINNTAVISLSSGTTSSPKGICLTHKSFLAQSVIMCDTWKLGNLIKLTNFTQKFDHDFQYVFMTSSPLYWITGALICVCSILGGMARVVSNSFDATTFCKNIAKYKVNSIMVQPTQAYELYVSNQWNHIDSRSLQAILMVGSVVSEDLRKNIELAFPTANVCSVYGQTEACGCIFGYNFRRNQDLNLLKTNKISCGRPLPGNKYKIIDLHSGKHLGPFQKGELKIKSNFYSKGYYKNAEKIYDQDGWISTGDIFYYDENKCFYIVDRVKDMIKYQLFNLNPSDIETILIQHPSIKECFVFGYPDEKDGELPMAVVMLKENEKNVTEHHIFKFVENQLPDRFQLRGGIKFVKNFIKTPTGKIKKLEMKKLIIENKKF